MKKHAIEAIWLDPETAPFAASMISAYKRRAGDGG
jgi:hypothetical protein